MKRCIVHLLKIENIYFRNRLALECIFENRLKSKNNLELAATETSVGGSTAFVSPLFFYFHGPQMPELREILVQIDVTTACQCSAPHPDLRC